jgi:hypothetical protein
LVGMAPWPVPSLMKLLSSGASGDTGDFDPWESLRWPTVRVLYYRQHKPDGTVIEACWLTNLSPERGQHTVSPPLQTIPTLASNSHPCTHLEQQVYRDSETTERARCSLTIVVQRTSVESEVASTFASFRFPELSQPI